MTAYVINDWPLTTAQVDKEMQLCWLFDNDMAVIDDIVIKGGRITVPALLQQRTLQQLHINHMGIEKTKLLARESIYCISINTNIENAIKRCTTYIEFQDTHLKTNKYHMMYQASCGEL